MNLFVIPLTDFLHKWIISLGVLAILDFGLYEKPLTV